MIDSELRYRVIESAGHDLLVDTVNHWLEKGWQCQGGISVTTLVDSGYVLYVQALVLEPVDD